MYEVHFYEDSRGHQPIRDLLVDLRDKARSSKSAHIQYHKILAYIRALESYGTRVGMPTVKFVGEDIWELRPLAHRVFFFYWRDNKFILLHHFIKKSQKTPLKEIEKAQRNKQDHIERYDDRDCNK